MVVSDTQAAQSRAIEFLRQADGAISALFEQVRAELPGRDIHEQWPLLSAASTLLECRSRVRETRGHLLAEKWRGVA
jgi:hypothetical protein